MKATYPLISYDNISDFTSVIQTEKKKYISQQKFELDLLLHTNQKESTKMQRGREEEESLPHCLRREEGKQ